MEKINQNKGKIRKGLIRLLHNVGLTNLTDEGVREYCEKSAPLTDKKPDRVLIERLNSVDNRIVYAGFDMFYAKDMQSVEESRERTKEYLRNLYENHPNRRNLVQRGVTFYLSGDGELEFDEKKLNILFLGTLRPPLYSPLKNIISCLKDGTELNNDLRFKVSLGLLDVEYFWYGRESAKAFRETFPHKRDLIFPGLLVYDSSLLNYDDAFPRVPENPEQKKKCIVNAIISDMEI